MSDIPDGFHQIAIQLAPEGSSSVLSTTTSYFVKEASIEDGTDVDCHAIIDNKIQKSMNCVSSGGALHFDLDMQELTNGVHKITLYLVPKGSTTVINSLTAFFIKLPAGGSQISRYCYWFDQDDKEMVTVECDVDRNAVEFLALVDAAQLPFRTSSYEFGIKEDSVVLTSKHDFNFRAMDNWGRFSNTQTKTYADSRSQRIIPIDGLENLVSCTNKKVGGIEEDDIKMYRFYAEVGDSLSLSLSQAASFELYSPTCNKVLERKGRLSESTSTAVLVETGEYYLAIHDIVGQDKRNESLNFHHVPRNAILNVNPTNIAVPGSIFCMELFGNGFDNARKLTLINDAGAKYEVDSLYALDNYHLVAAIEHGSDIRYGDYYLSLLVDDTVSGTEVSIEYPQSITIAKKTDNAKISVDVIPSKKASTPYMVDILLTNESEVPCWGIPFNVACELSDRDEDEQTSFEFYIKDFFGWDVPVDNFNWYETDNLLDKGVPGIILPMVISYFNPHETKTLRIGINSSAHEKIGLYAWAGEPYNEAAEKLLSLSDEEWGSLKFHSSNMYTLDTYSYLLWVMEEAAALLNSNRSAIKRAPADNDWVLQFMADNLPDLVSQIPGMDHPSNAAQRTTAVYMALAKTIAGIINCEDNEKAFRHFRDNCDIPGKSISEQLAYIYSHKMQENVDIKFYLEQVAKNMARTASPRQIMSELTSDLTDIPQEVCDAAFDLCSNQQAQNPNPMPERHQIESLQAWDPNDISGYTDVNGGPYIGLDARSLHYKIEFENDPIIANAPASVVIVENNLDGAVFDLSSYKPLSLMIGNHNVKLPEGKMFVTTVDMRPSINCILEIRHDFNEVSGESIWHFTSLDPMTLEIVNDSQQGFLPVNDSFGIGIGEIEYSISIKSGLDHNVELRNKASIIFDDNEAIETPEWINVTDYVKPTGMIVSCEVSPDGKTYLLDFECTDDDSGLHACDLCAKVSGSDDWIVVKPGVSDSPVKLELPEPIDNLEFAIRAADVAGNQQLIGKGISSTVENVIESSVQNDDSVELWFNLNGLQVNKSNTVNIPIISNQGKRIIILK